MKQQLRLLMMLPKLKRKRKTESKRRGKKVKENSFTVLISKGVIILNEVIIVHFSKEIHYRFFTFFPTDIIFGKEFVYYFVGCDFVA